MNRIVVDEEEEKKEYISDMSKSHRSQNSFRQPPQPLLISNEDEQEQAAEPDLSLDAARESNHNLADANQEHS